MKHETIDLIKKTMDSVYYDLDKTRTKSLLGSINVWNIILRIDLFITIPCIVVGLVLMATVDFVIGLLLFLLSIFGLSYIVVISSKFSIITIK